MQHPDISVIHPHSLNTIRIFTYRSVKDEQVRVMLAMLRMGVSGNFVDNASIDGIASGIDLESGSLLKYAFNKYGEFWSHHPDTGISFEGYRIPHFEDIKVKVTKLADVLAHNRLIGWDIGINDKGAIVLIEPNIGTGIWMLQLANGKPLFGDLSDEVRNYCRERKKR